MLCPSCRREIADASRFCGHCGAALAASWADTRPAAAAPPRPPSTDPIDQARFIPGTMLADRYRIVALLGHGGMGEVYRAEDLKLGQAVALKFLPDGMAEDPTRLARFHQEVRLARQVSHPNVCRMYDVGEAEGQPFLTMEYVDGEDLASLLRRIGRLPQDKAVQLGRQLCAGLAAAHDRGILHGDLKPANILLDGRGRIRVADFGLAALSDVPQDTQGVVAGTPAYMAPEQRAAQGTSMRSDVYALGLVLYEMFTGKPALAAVAGRAWPDPDSSTVTTPSQLITDLDPAIDRVILRCLEPDPARRPASAVAVAAALPGGDPLAAALAAGETPSPEMVAAAAETGMISPRIGLACLAAIAAGLVAIGVLSSQFHLFSLVPLERAPAIVAERARTILRELGYEDEPAREQMRYEVDQAYLDYIREDAARATTGYDAFRSNRPPLLLFRYQAKPASTGDLLDVPWDWRRPLAPGTREVVTDTEGRLISFVAVPDSGALEAGAAPPDWGSVFALAELPLVEFMATERARVPPVYADTIAAWTGVHPGDREVPIRIEAAGLGGRPVQFGVELPWTRYDPASGFAGSDAFAVIMLVGLLLAAPLALRNMRLGRSDRRGALRLGLYVGILYPLGESVRALTVVPLLFLEGTAIGAAVWLLYTAYEPHLRRVWPDMLVGWNRVLLGRVRDPLIGRDLLVGVLAGVVFGLSYYAPYLLASWVGEAVPVPYFTDENTVGQVLVLLGGLQAAAAVLWSPHGAGISMGLLLVTALFLPYLVLRRRPAAVGVAFVVLMLTGLFNTWAGPGAVALLVGSVRVALMLFVLLRYGFFALVVCIFTMYLTLIVPLTLDTGVPYAGASYLMIGTIVALALYGFHTALAGRSLFGTAFLDGEPARPSP